MAARPFHYSFPVRDLDEARRFYGGLLACAEGRSAPTWVDFDFFGNQLSAHLGAPTAAAATGQVDGVAVPIPHFGAILDPGEFEALAARLRAAGVGFLVEPRLRFEGRPGEQHTMFFRDPSGNAIEIKAYR